MRSKSAEHFDSDRIIKHALPKNFKVLLGEYSSRREDCDLSAIHDRFERGANRNFRFAESDVAANQTVHWPRLLHVDLGVDNGLHLVGRFAKRKRMFEFALPLRVGAKRVTGNGFALGLDGEHFSGVIENG